MSDPTAASVTSIYEANRYESRTFLGLNQIPVMSLTIDKNDQVSGVSTFQVDGTGNILWVDAHKMVDQDSDPTNGTQLLNFDARSVAGGGTMNGKTQEDTLNL